MFKKVFNGKYILIFLLLSFIFAIGWFLFKHKKGEVDYVKNGGFSVHFVDVGQGDCELIISDGKAILIDGGESDKGNFVVRYLRNCGVKKIDCLIATHPHTDHIGGLNAVLKKFDVDKMIMPKIPKKHIPTNAVYKKFIKQISEKNIPVKQPRCGDVLNFGQGSLKIIGPQSENYEKLNDFSVGALFCYGKFSFLFCGDMEKSAEKDVLKSNEKIKADVFKLSHHGSKTSNTKKFLEAVGPKFCVAEVGRNNSYGHPHRQTLKTLKKLNIKKLFRTDIDGTIIFSTDGEKLYYNTEKEEK